MKGPSFFCSILAGTLLLTTPAPAFWGICGDADSGDSGTWGKIVTGARETLKHSARDDGNTDTPRWKDITSSASEAIDQFAKDGKGFDTMQRAVRKTRRHVQRLAADENSTLTGRFYDLKQPVAPGTRPLSRHSVVSFIHDFMASGWDRGKLEQYYSPEMELAAPYFYLPRCKASYAPEAFNCNQGNQKKQVRPQDWVVHYAGIVTAPESGTYRFVGMGDDTIVVRFNEDVVLESGWTIPSRNHMTLGTKRDYQAQITSKSAGCALYQYPSTPHWNNVLGGIASGRTFKVEQGMQYPIEILISEIPGNEFGYCLLIEKVEGESAAHGQFAPGHSPTLALFRTNATTPDLEEIEEALKKDGKDYTVSLPLEVPPFAEDSPIWAVVPAADTEKRNILERTAATVSNEETAMGRRVEGKKGKKKARRNSEKK
ncbi:MAG: hypothetical protein IKA23_02980 [Akkermansia sp.]|nr:hypothetical protein [Akkermansia sp.]